MGTQFSFYEIFQSFKARIQPSDGSLVSGMHHLYSYLVYLRLTKTIERNMLMIESLRERLVSGDAKTPANVRVTKPQDIIRLYETNLQVWNHSFYSQFTFANLSRSFNSVFMLPFQNYTEVKQILELDEDSDLFHSIDVQIFYNKAFRYVS